MPVGVLICGAPGTGKSTYVHKVLENAGFEGEFVLVDPDKIKADTHAEQSKMAFELLEETVSEKKDVVYVGSCLSVGTLNNIMKEMKRKKYRTVVAVSYTSLSTALKRLAERKDQPLDSDIASEVHRYFATKAERYMNLHSIDEIYLYNNETNFNLLFSRKKKKITCSDPEGEFYFDVSKYCN
jgi:predicted ABC-type ATPase